MLIYQSTYLLSSLLTYLLTYLPTYLLTYFVSVFCVGPAVTHRMYCSLPRLIVLNAL
jgi:hypothetical protein